MIFESMITINTLLSNILRISSENENIGDNHKRVGIKREKKEERYKNVNIILNLFCIFIIIKTLIYFL